MACGSDPTRVRFNDPGWECDGTGLVYLMRGPEGIPVVGPRSAWAEFKAEPWADIYPDEPRSFKGEWDHYHAVLPSGKPAESQR